MTEQKEESWTSYFKRHWGASAFLFGWLIRTASVFVASINEWLFFVLYFVGYALWFVWVVSVIIWIGKKISPKKTENENKKDDGFIRVGPNS
jgi:hypothetical protein